MQSNRDLSRSYPQSEDAARTLAYELSQEAIVRVMPTAGWVSLTATCPFCQLEMQSACDQHRAYSDLQQTPMALAAQAVEWDLFMHINAFHKGK